MAKTLPLIGYCDPLSGRPGDTIEFKVSSALQDPCSTRLVKVICSDPNPAGPGLIEYPIEDELQLTFPSEHQPFHPGSYGEIEYPVPILSGEKEFTISAVIWPTLITSGIQTILTFIGGEAWGHGLGIDAEGHLVFVESTKEGGDQVLVQSEEKLRLRSWYRVYVSIDTTDAQNPSMKIGTAPLENGSASETVWSTATRALPSHLPTCISKVVLAATLHPHPRNHYNGKLESPSIHKGSTPSNESLISLWDFGQKMSSESFVDVGPAKADGKLVNLPTRAVMASQWTGEERNWRHSPSEYAAIHFHDDDIYDFKWKTSFKYTIPEHLKSGVYAVKISCGEYEDNIPFFVVASQSSQTKLCVLVSTFTYVVYGNYARPDFEPSWLDHWASRGGYPYSPSVYKGYGASTYNVHSDGSGICHASHRRPLMNNKLGFIHFGNTQCSGLRHFQADSHLTAWLDACGIDYDIVTDQELQNEGVRCIERYSALMTGTHPEYHTPKMLDALTDFRKKGKNMMYLGGNGFYWRIAEHPEVPGTLEIRRTEGGIRAWASEPGEYYHAFDGGYGGLWRRNNRPPQKLGGVGFTAQGRFSGTYYRRTEESFTNPEAKWIFDGIEDEKIGDFGLSGFGAAGFELDRFDAKLGSGEETVILAHSEGHKGYVLVFEEQLTHLMTCSGDAPQSLVRADMVYQCDKDGSQLFATGSITFCGSLLENDANNNVSKLLMNVTKRFTQN